MPQQENVLMVRDRLPDGTFGPVRKAFEQAGETIEEKAARLEKENLQLREELNVGLMEMSMLVAALMGGEM